VHQKIAIKEGFKCNSELNAASREIFGGDFKLALFMLF
jgi:hypothetical protein